MTLPGNGNDRLDPAEIKKISVEKGLDLYQIIAKARDELVEAGRLGAFADNVALQSSIMCLSFSIATMIFLSEERSVSSEKEEFVKLSDELFEEISDSVAASMRKRLEQKDIRVLLKKSRKGDDANDSAGDETGKIGEWPWS